MALKVVCSYCKKDMGEKPSEHTGISHGGCPHCLRLVTIEDVLADKIEAEAVELFGQTTKLAEAKYVLRDGTLIGSKERVHSEICSIDEVLEHILLDREPSLRMTLEEARAKYPGKSLMDILDMEIGEAFIDACPDTFKFITGAGRIVPDAGGYYFAFQKMPTMMQAAVMEKALKEKPSLGVEISKMPNYAYLTFQRPTPARGILKRLREASEKVNLGRTTGKIPTMTSGKELERKAIEEFGITEDPLMAGYLLKDGRFLDFSGGSGVRAFDHRQVEGFFSDQELDFIRDKDGARTHLMWEFMARTGAIRMKPEGCAAESPEMFPTRPQARSLNDYAFVCEGTVLLEVWRNGNPRSTLSGFFVAGDVDSIIRVSKMMEAHPERFGGKRAFVVGKKTWGIAGLGSVCRTSFDALHSHGYTVDAMGNGETTTDMLHHHDIVSFNVIDGGIITHGHTLGSCLAGVPHLGQLEHGIVTEWVDWAKEKLRVVPIPAVAHWIMPDGLMIETPMSHDDICWGMLPERVGNALEEALLEQFNYYEHLDLVLEENPDEDASEIRREFIHDLMNSGVAKDWCEGLFIAMTGAIRHASRAFPTVVPTFEGPMPTLDQAVQIAREIEDRRPAHSGAMIYLHTDSGRTVALMFPAKPTASSVIAKIERALEGDGGHIDAFLGQMLPKVGAGDSPAELAVKTYGIENAKGHGHILPHLSGPPKKMIPLHFFAQGLKDKAEHTTDIDETAFILTDGTQIALGDASSHQDVLFDNLPREPHPGELLNPALFIQRTGSVRVVHGMGRVFFEAGRIPTSAQTKVILDAHSSGRTGDVLELEFVDKNGDFVTYQDERPSEKRMRFFFNKHRSSLLEGLGLGAVDVPRFGDSNFADAWLAEAKGSFEEAELAEQADWILPDGTLLKTNGHSMVCWALQDGMIQGAINEELKEWYGFYDSMDQFKEDFPELTEGEIEQNWIDQMTQDQNANDWCEERFIDVTESVRHASVSWGTAKPAFELREIPTNEQAARIAEIIEQRRPMFLGEAEFYFGSHFIQLEFPKRASAAGVIAKLKREVEGSTEFYGIPHLGQLEPSIDLQIIGLVDELINRRETPKIDAVKRAARDLQEKLEKLADEAGVEIRFVEGTTPGPKDQTGLIAVSDLEEKVNIVRLRPATSEERAQWERDKEALARAEEHKIKNPFDLGDGKLVFGSREHVYETLDMLEFKMRDKFLDWLESLGHYCESINIELYVYDRPGIMKALASSDNEEMSLEEITWKLVLSSQFPMMVGGGYQAWKSEEMAGVKASDINLVMKRFERPLDSLRPNDPWPVGMIENFNNAWDSYASEQHDFRDMASNPFADPGMSQVYLHTKVAGTAWNLAAMYVPSFSRSNWFAAELVSTDHSKVKIPAFENVKDLVAPFLSEKELDKLAQDVGLTNVIYISQDWPLVIQPHFWNLTGPGLIDLEDAFRDSLGQTNEEIVRVVFEAGHVNGLRAAFGNQETFAEDFPVLVERMVCTLDQLAKLERPVGETLRDWRDVRASDEDLLTVIERSHYKRLDTSGPYPLQNFRFAFSEIARTTCSTTEAASFLKRKQRPESLRGRYSYQEGVEPLDLEFVDRPTAPGDIDALDGLGELPTPSDIVTSLVAHLQAVANGRLEVDVAEGQDAAIDKLLRSIKTFATRLQASCACDTGFEWCCPPDKRILPRPPISRADEDDLSGIRSQLERLGGYAVEGIEMTPIFVKGRDGILLKLKDRAGQFTYRDAPKHIRRQLSNMSAPPDTGRVWRDTQIRSFWYVLASNDRFKLDEQGWRWSLEAPPEFFGAQFMSGNKKYHGLVMTNYEWAITSSRFFYDRPDTLIHINTGISSKAFLPFPIFDRDKEMDPKVQLGIMRCIALEANSMVPDGLMDQVKVLKHVQFGSEKVTGKEADTYQRGVDNLAHACRDAVDNLPSKQRRSVTFRGLHGAPQCLLGSCEVKNG